MVRLSVGEFIRFSPLPAPGERGGSAGLWRARVGTEWHQAIHEATRSNSPGAVFEWSVSARFPGRRWTLELQGRIDQILPGPDGHWMIREIKTTGCALPMDEAALRERYPAYFLQLACYEMMLRQMPEGRERFDPLGEGVLLFLDPGTGITQTIRGEGTAENLFTAQWTQLENWLIARQDRWEVLRSLPVVEPFPELREGQEETWQALATSLLDRPQTLFSAPTGFGKTAFAWSAALQAYQKGRIRRIIFLSSKTSGQWQALHELERLLPAPSPLRWLRMQRKEKHCLNTVFHCFRESCSYLRNGEEVSAEAWRSPRFRLTPGFTLEEARREGERLHICPYEITRASLREADIWIGDVNYLFSPFHQSMFTGQWGYHPEETLLIIDEAHQLPDRTAANWSLVLSLAQAEAVLGDFTFQTIHPKLTRAWEDWHKLLARIRPSEELNPEEQTFFQVAAGALWEAWENHLGSERARLSPVTLEAFEAIEKFLFILQRPDLPRLLWCESPGNLRLTCLDAAPLIAETVRPFAHTLFLSATFGGKSYFLGQCGLAEENTGIVHAATPWRKSAYTVAIDERVNTRWQDRERYLETTAATIDAMKSSREGPLVVFLPSFRYARQVAESLDTSCPQWRIALQEPGSAPEKEDGPGQTDTFLEDALLFHDIILLVLGSHYSESIDALGGRISQAMVVGPALPQVNAEQKARLNRHPSSNRETAFHEVYRIPGMRKVNQALGRLIRAPGQTTRILLHCQRFAEPPFLDLLHPDYPVHTVITNTGELNDWLKT